MNMFAVGDRVVCVAAYASNLTSLKQIGMVGTVKLIIFGGRCAVQHDEYCSNCHTCEGLVEQGYGWYYFEDELALYNDMPLDLDDLI